MTVNLINVLVEIVGLVEALLANGALVGFESLVDPEMRVEVILLVEEPVAHETFVRTLSGVGSNVRFKVVGLDELLVAVRAAEGFRRGVDQRVAGKFFLILEGTRTH